MAAQRILFGLSGPLSGGILVVVRKSRSKLVSNPSRLCGMRITYELGAPGLKGVTPTQFNSVYIWVSIVMEP